MSFLTPFTPCVLFPFAVVSFLGAIKQINENYHCIILYIKKSMYKGKMVNYLIFKIKSDQCFLSRYKRLFLDQPVWLSSER